MNEQAKALISGILGVLILILAFSGCTSANQTLEPTETFNLQTRLAQITPSDTPTLIPSFTPDPNATQFKPESLTPTPTPPFLAGSENSLFPIPNRPFVPGDYSTTPIPTPKQPLGAYRLKEWDQEDALQLIQLMDAYSYDAGVAIDYNHSLFPLMQRMVNLSGEEFLYRFPNSIYSEDVGWKTALSGLHFSDTDLFPLNVDRAVKVLVRERLERILNNLGISPEELNSYLGPKGFRVNLDPVENLQGNEKTAFILRLFPVFNDGENESLLYIVIRDGTDYQVNFLHESWLTNDDVGILESFRDQDQDGIPEIVFFDGNKLRIVEWEDGQFVDHSKDQMNLYAINQDYSYYDFDPEEYPGIDLITKSNLDDRIQVLWVWEDGAYSPADEVIIEPFEVALRMSWTLSGDDYQKLLGHLEWILSDWEVIDSYDWNHLGVDLDDKDVWRLHLGFAYLLRDVDRGLEIIRSVANNPEFPEDPMPALIAATFLENYSGKRTEMIPACQAVRDLNPVDKDSRTHNPWAFQSHYLALFCDDNLILEYMINQYQASELEALINQLSNEDEFDHRQFSLNGVPAELIRYGDLFILFEHDGKLVKSNYPGWRFFFSELDDMVIQQVELSGIDSLIYKFRRPGEFAIVNINLQEKIPEINLLNQFFFSEAFEEFDFNGMYSFAGVEIYAFIDQDDECNYSNDIDLVAYAWDETYLDFYEIDLLEKIIYEFEDFPLAISKAKQYISILEPFYRTSSYLEDNCEFWNEFSYGESEYEYPRLLYLLGLAYELNGDKTLAVQTYYRLWQEAPDSGYALMARAKLEEVGP